MPIGELAARWCRLQSMSVSQQFHEWAAAAYFNELPHDSPVRAYALVLSVLATETDRSVRLQLNNEVMATLMHAHGATLIDRIETDARDNGALRWLLGGAYWWTQDKTIEQRLLAVADVETFNADREAHRSRNEPIDFGALSTDELARAWVKQTAQPSKDHDDNWSAFQDCQRDLIEQDPDAAIDLIVAVLKIETDPALLSLLAAGPLEDVISMQVIDRIAREAAADPRFLSLLQGVWYSSKPDDVKACLDSILGRTKVA
jgi:hypothetical protein